jgi:hypothetical protein
MSTGSLYVKDGNHGTNDSLGGNVGKIVYISSDWARDHRPDENRTVTVHLDDAGLFCTLRSQKYR